MMLSRLPIVQAPMAGASGPALAAAVTAAGGVGFLAAGYKTAEGLRAEIAEVSALTGGPFGVNVFVPSSPGTDEAALRAYRERLRPEAVALGVPLGEPQWNDDDWDAKLALLLDDPVPMVSFTFGRPAPETVAALRDRGTLVAVTVTTPDEARLAAEAGAQALVAQGIEAGAHRGAFTDGPDVELRPLLKAVCGGPLPVIAAGGLMTGRDIAAVLGAGAVAAQLGTAFLRCPESSAPAAHKAALASDAETAVTRAFSGRRARGLVNRFLLAHGPYAPAAYPQIHTMVSPLRKAAAARGDAGRMALWAGTGHRQAEDRPAAEIVARLAGELAEARG
jgi:nitronate monooxygenase